MENKLNLSLRLFITREEIAQILGVSISSVDRGLKANNPPFNKAVRIGRRVLFPSSCLNQFLLKEEILKK